MVEQLICFGYIHEKTADKATGLYRLFFHGWLEDYFGNVPDQSFCSTPNPELTSAAGIGKTKLEILYPV